MRSLICSGIPSEHMRCPGSARALSVQESRAPNSSIDRSLRVSRSIVPIAILEFNRLIERKSSSIAILPSIVMKSMDNRRLLGTRSIVPIKFNRTIDRLRLQSRSTRSTCAIGSEFGALNPTSANGDSITYNCLNRIEMIPRDL